MSSDRRGEVRDVARYLRAVRPIDPDEIVAYLSDPPHPGVVRRDLRAMAVDLGLRERSDGTFVPVEAGPVSEPFDGVAALPAPHVDRLAALLVEAYGPDWPTGRSGARLRRTIREMKAAYLDGRAVTYDRETALAYAIYHLPQTYATVQYVLAELLAGGLVPRELSVVDVGAGVGGPALGFHDLLFEGGQSTEALVDYHAIEPSGAADVFEAMTAATDRNYHVTVHRSTAESVEPPAEADLVLFANVLSELADPVAVVERYLSSLAPTGSLVAIEPADRETATGLRAIERRVADDRAATIYAPTVRLWPGEAPTDRGWSFVRHPDIAVPSVQRRLAEAATDPDHDPEEYVNVDIQYAYTVLRTDGRRSIDVTLDPDRVARMAEMDRHVTERIDCFAVKLSPDIGTGEHPLYKVGDGSEQVDHYAVLVDETALNGDLRTAEYGALLRLEGTLVLWNDDEDGYNLVVDAETVVDRVPVRETSGAS